MTFVLALLAWCTLIVENDAEQVDSGWAVAVPSTIATGSATHDLQQQAILDHVLEQTRTPLLLNRRPPVVVNVPAPAAGNASKADIENAKEELKTLRIAVRPDGIEGWRPAGRAVPPLHEPAQASSGKPQLAAPVKNNQLDVSNDSAVKLQPSADKAAPQASSPDAAEASVERADSDTTKQAESFAAKLGAATKLKGNATSRNDVADEDGKATDADAKAEQNESAVDSPPAAVAPPPLTRQLVSLRSRVRGVLKGYYRKTLNSRENDPWEVMHGMLAYGVNSRILQGGPRGEAATAVGWLCYNKPCKGQTLMYVTPKGELRAKYGVGLQGHLGQLLAMLAQCRVSEEYPIRVGKREFTIRDLIEAEKKTCYPKSELTFKLLALQYYLDLNETWVNDQGLEWGFPRLIREELAQPIRGAACGGTHRLSSLSLTVKNRVRRGEPLDGEYARAAEFVEKYHQYAFRLQNRDGSLSTSWFQGRGDDSDINRRIKTTGHILEWLCYSLSDEELRDQRTIRAVTYLANLMYSNYDNEWEVGPMSHATHALLLYDERVFQPFDGSKLDVAAKSKSSTAKRSPTRSGRR